MVSASSLADSGRLVRESFSMRILTRYNGHRRSGHRYRNSYIKSREYNESAARRTMLHSIYIFLGYGVIVITNRCKANGASSSRVDKRVNPQVHYSCIRETPCSPTERANPMQLTHIDTTFIYAVTHGTTRKALQTRNQLAAQ